jgi:hypothetical protein
MKYDGYRGPLYLEHGKGPRLISRNGRTMKRFSALAWALVPLIDAEAAISDSEIVTKDASGRPIFPDLMRRPNDASYAAFDLLWLNGRDLRRASEMISALRGGAIAISLSASLISFSPAQAIPIIERGSHPDFRANGYLGQYYPYGPYGPYAPYAPYPYYNGPPRRNIIRRRHLHPRHRLLAIPTAVRKRIL